MKENKWYNNLQLCAMTLMACSMPIGWRVGLWMAALLALVSVVKMVAERHIGNPSLGKGIRWMLYLIGLYWIGIVVSVLWSGNIDKALNVVKLKAVLLIFPLSLLLTDTSYIKMKHCRLLGYALLTSCCILFFYWLVRTVTSAAAAGEFANIGSMSFDKRHHSYIALYITVALTFVYFELVSQWNHLKRPLRVALIASVPVLVLYAVLINSRAGLLCLFAVEIACMGHWAVFRHGGWKVLPVALLLLGFTVGIGSAIPGHNNRLLATFIDINSDEPDDPRLKISSAAWRVAQKQLLVGYGAGDYKDELIKAYDEDGYEAGVQHKVNAHNQYLESLLAAGVVELALLLSMLLLPSILAFSKRSNARWLVLSFAFILLFNLIFESMFERQMGLLFTGVIYIAIALIMSTEQNKFG